MQGLCDGVNGGSGWWGGPVRVEQGEFELRPRIYDGLAVEIERGREDGVEMFCGCSAYGRQSMCQEKRYTLQQHFSRTGLPFWLGEEEIDCQPCGCRESWDALDPLDTRCRHAYEPNHLLCHRLGPSTLEHEVDRVQGGNEHPVVAETSLGQEKQIAQQLRPRIIGSTREIDKCWADDPFAQVGFRSHTHHEAFEDGRAVGLYAEQVDDARKRRLGLSKLGFLHLLIQVAVG